TTISSLNAVIGHLVLPLSAQVLGERIRRITIPHPSAACHGLLAKKSETRVFQMASPTDCARGRTRRGLADSIVHSETVSGGEQAMQTCDLLIVGGGVMGVSIAHALASRRVGRVVVLEKAYLGAGSSGKSGAIIRQHYSNRLTASLVQK